MGRIELTGQLVVQGESGTVLGTDLPGRQGRLVLARLALADHPVAREELADVVWSDELPKSWERDLSTVVSKVKSALAGITNDMTIASVLGCYQLMLGPAVGVDVIEATAGVELAEAALRAGEAAGARTEATRALDIARRPILPGEDSAWVDARRAEHRRLLVRALDVLVAALVTEEMLTDVLRYATEAVELEPFRETGYAALIGVQLAAGNRADALRTYERARKLLAEELGIPPSELLERAYRRALDADAPPVESHAEPTVVTRGLPNGTVTLVFTDMVGSTELAESLGAERFEEVRRRHFRVLRDAAATRRGHEVKNVGDGLMLAFAAAGDAVACAVDIQQAVERENRRSNHSVMVRVGVHVGEPVFEDGDYFGLPVAIASRLCGAAEAGEIVASDVARVLAGAEGAAFTDARQLQLKGVGDAAMAWTVAWERGQDRALPLPAAAQVTPDAAFGFVGRMREIDELLSGVGDSAVALVAGDPGAGKTRTIAEAVTRAHEKGASVLWGRCEQSGLRAYQPFVDALRHLIAAAAEPDLRRWVGSGAPELSRLSTELAARLGGVAPTVETTGEGDRARLFEAVGDLLASVAADRPLVVVIDDAHWIDPGSGLLLQQLASARLPNVLVVIAYRPTELDRSHPLGGLVTELRRDDHVSRIQLPPLTEADVSRLLGGTADTLSPERAALAGELVALTDGNPFFVREIIRHLEESGRLDRTAEVWRFEGGIRSLGIPEGVRDVVGRRLSRFSDELNGALRVAAVVGREWDLDILAAASDGDEDHLLDLLDAALGASLVAEVPGRVDRFTFSHAIVQETLAAEIAASRRVRLHRRVAEAIEARRAGRPEYVEELAHHYAEAAPTGTAAQAVRYAIAAADLAVGRWAYEDADAHLLRALELADEAGLDRRERAELLIVHATVLRSLGSRGQKEAAFAAAAIAREIGDNDLLGRVAESAIDDWTMLGMGSPAPDHEIVGLLEEALERNQGSALGVRLEAYRGVTVAVLRPEEVFNYRQLLEKAQRVGDPETVATVHRLWWDDGWSPSEGAREAIEEVRAFSKARDDARSLLAIEISEVTLAGFRGDLTRVHEAIRSYDEILERTRLRSLGWLPRMWKAALTLLEGRFGECLALTAPVEGLGPRMGRYAAGQIGITQYYLFRDLGQLEGVHEIAGHMAQRIPDFSFAASHVLGLYESGHGEEAARQYAEYGDRRLQVVHSYFMPTAWFLRTLTEHRVGVDDMALECYEQGLEYRDIFIIGGMFNVCWGSAQYGLGLRADQLERWDDADEHFRLARERNESIGSPTYVAYAEHDHARMLLRRGRTKDRDEARALARSALSTAERLGMARLEFEARETLQSAQ